MKSLRSSHLLRRVITPGLLLSIGLLGGAPELTAQTIVTVAGSGETEIGFQGDGGPAQLATLALPSDVDLDAQGNLYITDRFHNRIRKVTPDGIITTVAGNGDRGANGDGGPATQASLYYPKGMAIDSKGTIFIADTDNHRIRKVTPNGIITTVAGNGAAQYNGDGIPATQAGFQPYDVAVDKQGNLFIADRSNNRIRKVNPDGIISTVAGTGAWAYGGDGGPANQAAIALPTRVAVDSQGNLLIADTENNLIRKVTPDGIIRTVAGTRAGGFYGDGMLATQTSLAYPKGITTDAQGNLYIADGSANRIRRVDKDGIISTLAGNGVYAFGGDGGPATEASLALPEGLAVDPQGNVYIADLINCRIRKVVVPTTPLTVISFSLMNAETNQEIRLLKAGEVVNLATLPTNKVTIRANTWPYAVGSVAMKLTGTQRRTQTEDQSPYALFGDDNRNLRPWTPTVGSYSLTATAYSGAGASGSAGQPLTLAFSFVDQPTLMSFSLIDANTDEEIIQLSANHELNLYWVGEQKFNIRANTGLSKVGSVVMQLSGPQNRTQTENQAPYALFGDAQGDYNPWLPRVGTYTLTGTLYSEPDGKGVAATPLTINLQVVNYHPESRLGTEVTANAEELQIRSFPNPFTESFRLKLSGKRPGKLPVVIYDGYGRMVQQLEDIQDEQLFSLGNGYAPGLYVLKVGEGKTARRFKMVKRL